MHTKPINQLINLSALSGGQTKYFNVNAVSFDKTI